VEDEISDGAARFTKIRPMRMEMFLRGDLRGFRNLAGLRVKTLEWTAGRLQDWKWYVPSKN